MHRRSIAALVAVLAIGFIATAPVPAVATTILALDLRSLVRGADHIVVATALDAEARWDHLDRIVTDTTLRVEERMHGPSSMAAGSTVTIRSLGGALGGVGLRVEGEPFVDVGERVLVFGRLDTADRVLRAVGMSQGVMRIARIDGAEMVLPGGQGLSLVDPGSDGQLRPAPAATMEPAPADELLSQVRDLIAEIHGGR